MARNFEQAIVDEADIVERLERLYSDRAEARRLGEAGRRFVQQFEWQTARAEFVRLVRECR